MLSPLQAIPNGATPEQLASTPSRKAFERKQVSPIDKFLKLPTNPRLKPSQFHAVTGARVLTSADCLAVIREKELKKQQEEQDKENRRKVREEKKKQREEEKLKKAQEKKRKDEDKMKKANEKELVKAQKAEEKKRRAEMKRQAEAREQAEGDVQEASSSRSLRTRQPQRSSPMIASNRCCVCDQTFEEDMELGGGVEWVQCACLRWLHEDCVFESSIDSNGKEKLCPFC